MDINQIATNLVPAGPGAYQSRSLSQVSYPEYGNELCLELEDVSFWFQHRNRCILAALQSNPPAGTLFDIGGGNGFVAQAALQAGWETVLVEPGFEGVQNARRRGLPLTIHAAFEDAGFLPGSLPAVGLFDVLEHIQDDTGLLTNLRTALVPGGFLYLTVPAYRCLWSSEDEAAGHFRRYTLDQINHLLTRCQFNMVYSTYYFALLPLPILLLRAIPSRMGRRIKIDPVQEKSEHQAAPGITGWILEKTLSWEAGQIRRGHPLPFGGSCLVVAQKPAGYPPLPSLEPVDAKNKV